MICPSQKGQSTLSMASGRAPARYKTGQSRKRERKLNQPSDKLDELQQVRKRKKITLRFLFFIYSFFSFKDINIEYRKRHVRRFVATLTYQYLMDACNIQMSRRRYAETLFNSIAQLMENDGRRRRRLTWWWCRTALFTYSYSFTFFFFTVTNITFLSFTYQCDVN